MDENRQQQQQKTKTTEQDEGIRGVRERLFFSAGASPILGADARVLEMEIGPGRRYDPSRDVLVFMPYALHGLARALRDRDIPCLRDLDPEMEARVIYVLRLLLEVMKSVEHEFEDPDLNYRTLSDRWAELLPADKEHGEAANILAALMGRLFLEFYIENVFNTIRPEENRWTCNMDQVIRQCLQVLPETGSRT